MDTRSNATFSRRTCLKAAAGLILPPSAFAIAEQARAETVLKRAASLTPWITETLIAIGAPPIAVPEVKRGWSSRRFGTLPQPPIDLGLLGEPNLELMDQLHLDYIFMDAGLQGSAWKKIMEPITEVVMGELYTEQLNPLERAERETIRFGGLLNCQAEARRFVDEAHVSIEDARESIEDNNGRPVFVVRLIDDRNVMLYGKGSIFYDVLVRLGMTAAAPFANDWGFITTGVETLAAVPDARILYFSPVPADAARLFAGPSLWSHLPSVQKRLATAIPEFYSWGGLQTARSFAQALSQTLRRIGTG